jgi:hypothetical protein
VNKNKIRLEKSKVSKIWACTQGQENKPGALRSGLLDRLASVRDIPLLIGRHRNLAQPDLELKPQGTRKRTWKFFVL